MNIEKAGKYSARNIARIHRESISTGFLSSLGLNFLTKLYEFIISNGYSNCYVYVINNKIVGFCCITNDSKRLYGDFLKKHLLLAAKITIINLFKIDTLRKIVDHLFYNSKKDKLPNAELLSVAVISGYKRKKIGSQLFDYIQNKFKKQNIKKFVIATGANNIESNEYFKSQDCKLYKKTQLHHNQDSHIYIKIIK